MPTYKIVRHFQNHENEVILTGQTLEQVQAHCQNPETSSRTAKSKDAVQLTQEKGPWFDGYAEENKAPWRPGLLGKAAIVAHLERKK